MIHQVWRLSEPGDGNLGLACSDEGLLLGRTPLIERRNGRFAVRERSEIERLLSRAYRAELPTQRLMNGLANRGVSLERERSRLGADCGGPFAHPGPAEPSRAGRDGSGGHPHQTADWNPALHPRAGTAPNPGWFAASGTEQPSPARVAQSDTPGRRASPTGKNEATIRQSSEDFQENPSLIVSIADNQRQNKQARDVAVILKMTKAQADELHRRISGQGYDYREILKIGREIVGDE
jgi:hypothetical protein